jgi:hypothetical protein
MSALTQRDWVPAECETFIQPLAAKTSFCAISAAACPDG